MLRAKRFSRLQKGCFSAMRRNIYHEYVTTDSLARELHEKYVTSP